MNFLPLRGGRVLGAILNRSESRCVKPNGQHLVHCSPERWGNWQASLWIVEDLGPSFWRGEQPESN
jgi:hypothetical protein